MYAIVQDPKPANDVLLKDIHPALVSDKAAVLGAPGEALCEQEPCGLRITLPEGAPTNAAYTLRFQLGTELEEIG